jgi:hypothetical protein
VATQNDLMGDAALASSQRAQFQLMARKGMLSTFLTSTRGIEGIAGAGLKGPPSLAPGLASTPPAGTSGAPAPTPAPPPPVAPPVTPVNPVDGSPGQPSGYVPPSQRGRRGDGETPVDPAQRETPAQRSARLRRESMIGELP